MRTVCFGSKIKSNSNLVQNQNERDPKLKRRRMPQLLLSALETVYDAASDAGARRAAQDVLDRFARRPEAASESLQLFSAASVGNAAAPVRLFALSTAEKAIRDFWDDFSEDVKTGIKAAAIEVVQCHLRLSRSRQGGASQGQTMVDPLFLRSKAVDLLVEIAKREWPQKWPQLLPTLDELVARDTPLGAEMALRVMRDLAEDCTNSDFNAEIPSRRRSEILQEVKRCLDAILNMCFRCLQHAFAETKKTDGVDAALCLAASTLSTLDVLAELAPLQSLIEKNLVLAVGEFLKPINVASTQVRVKAWQCLASFSRKNTNDRNTTVDMVGYVCSLVSLLRSCDDYGLPPLIPLVAVPSNDQEHLKVWPTFAIAASEDEISSRLVEMNSVHQEMAKTLSIMSSSYFGQLLQEGNANRPDNGKRSLEAIHFLLLALLRMMGHPSLSVRHNIVTGLANLLRTWKAEVVRKSETDSSASKPANDYLHSQCLLMLRNLSDHMICLGYPSGPSSGDFAADLWPSPKFSVDEFDGDEEFLAMFDSSRTHASNGIKVLAELLPAEVLRFTRWRLQLICGKLDLSVLSALAAGHLLPLLKTEEEFSREPLDILNPRQAFSYGTMISLVEACICAAKRETFKVLGNLQKVPAGHSQEFQKAWDLRQILELVLQFEPQSAKEIEPVLVALSKLSPCYGAFPDGPELFLFPVLNKMFSCAIFRRPEEVQSFSDETVRIRKRAGLALVDICSHLSSGHGSSPEIRSRLASLLPTFSEQVLKVLQNPANCVQPYERATFYDVLVTVSNCVEDENQVQQFIAGLVDEPICVWMSIDAISLEEDLAKAYNAFRQPEDSGVLAAKRALVLLLAVARASKSTSNRSVRPFGAHWVKILPNMLLLISVIHKFGAHRERFHELLFIEPEELRTILGKTGPDTSKPASKRSSKYLVVSLRELIYSGLGFASRYKMQGLFSVQEALQNLPSKLFGDIAAVENRHVFRLVMAFIVPCVQSCPKDFWDSFLFPLVIPLLEHMYHRLQIAWQILDHQKEGLPSGYDALRWDPVIDSPLNDPKSSEGISVEDLKKQQTDIARNASIRLLSSSFAELLAMILRVYPDGAGSDPKDMKANEICQRALRSDVTAGPLLLSLIGCFASNDSATFRKAAETTRKVLHTCLLPEQRFHLFVYNQLFTACFGALYAPKQKHHESAIQTVLQIITSIWVSSFHPQAFLPKESKALNNEIMDTPSRRVIHQTLRSVIGINAEKFLGEAEKDIARATTEKGRRNAVKNFIQDVVHAAGKTNPFDDKKRRERVSNLPQIQNGKTNNKK